MYILSKNPETYLHLFVYCEHAKNLWITIENLIGLHISKESIHFDIDTVMWNRLVLDKLGHIINFICLVVKQYIYRQRCLQKELNPMELWAIVWQI